MLAGRAGGGCVALARGAIHAQAALRVPLPGTIPQAISDAPDGDHDDSNGNDVKGEQEHGNPE
ncbi:MAG TPA: hypothetical protein VKB51_03430 [bacterium]|nr:hypothetical protein [bacterium]